MERTPLFFLLAIGAFILATAGLVISSLRTGNTKTEEQV